MGCPIRESADQRLLTTPHSLSQPSTPFFGSSRQGIHHAPLLAQHHASRRAKPTGSTSISFSPIHPPRGTIRLASPPDGPCHRCIDGDHTLCTCQRPRAHPASHWWLTHEMSPSRAETPRLLETPRLGPSALCPASPVKSGSSESTNPYDCFSSFARPLPFPLRPRAGQQKTDLSLRSAQHPPLLGVYPTAIGTPGGRLFELESLTLFVLRVCALPVYLFARLTSTLERWSRGDSNP